MGIRIFYSWPESQPGCLAQQAGCQRRKSFSEASSRFGSLWWILDKFIDRCHFHYEIYHFMKKLMARYENAARSRVLNSLSVLTKSALQVTNWVQPNLRNNFSSYQIVMMVMILMIFFFSLACRLTSSWVHGTRCSVKRSNVQFGNAETFGQVTHLWKQKNHGLWMKWNRQQIIDIFTKVYSLPAPRELGEQCPWWFLGEQDRPPYPECGL